jgi:hypothetical protein
MVGTKRNRTYREASFLSKRVVFGKALLNSKATTYPQQEVVPYELDLLDLPPIRQSQFRGQLSVIGLAN